MAAPPPGEDGCRIRASGASGLPRSGSSLRAWIGSDAASADGVIASVRDQGLVIDWLLETHAHADHLSAAPYLQQALGGALAIGRDIVRVQEAFGTIFNEGADFARADFLGGDARQLYRSIRRLLALPVETRLFLCHDCKAVGRDHYAWETVLGA